MQAAEMQPFTENQHFLHVLCTESRHTLYLTLPCIKHSLHGAINCTVHFQFPKRFHTMCGFPAWALQGDLGVPAVRSHRETQYSSSGWTDKSYIQRYWTMVNPHRQNEQPGQSQRQKSMHRQLEVSPDNAPGEPTTQ